MTNLRLLKMAGFHAPFTGWFSAPHDSVADSCACIAILTLTGPDEPLTTTDFNIRFLAACLTEVTAKAKVIKLGRTLCPVHVELFDAAGRMVAVSQVTYMRLPAPPRHGDLRAPGGGGGGPM